MKLHDVVAEYVAYKRALGMRFDTDADILGSFCHRVGEVPLICVTADHARTFLDGGSPVSSYWKRKYTALAGLYRFALSRGYASVSVLPSRHPQLPPALVPYIYSQAEIKRLLDATPGACGRQVPPIGGVCVSCPAPAVIWRLPSTRRSIASDDERCRS